MADTGPLIAMARIQQLDLLRRLYTGIVIPHAVHHELATDTRRPGAVALAAALKAGWLRTRATVNIDVAADLAQILDRGEAEAIALAEEIHPRFLLIDDARGRRVAQRRGVVVVGTAGVLLAAKSRAEIAAVGPMLEALGEAGYHLSSALVERVLAKAGE